MLKRIFPILALLSMLAGCATREAPHIHAGMFMAPTESAGNLANANATSKSPRAYLVSNWITAVSAGGPASLDSATITNPDTQIVNTTTIVLDRSGWIGNAGEFRIGYTGTPTADCVIEWYGKTGTGDWQRLVNVNGDTAATLTTSSTTDTTNGTMKFSHVDPVLHKVPFRGCDKIMVGIKTAFAGSVTNTAIIQVRPVEY